MLQDSKIVCLLTHGVDALYHYEESWMCFDKWLSIESKYNAKSAFYFIAALPEIKYPMPCRNYSIYDENIIKIIKKIEKSGWKVGLHSATYWNLNLMEVEKKALERILNRCVAGTRQHFLMISYNTLRNRAKLGYTYDTSLYKE